MKFRIETDYKNYESVDCDAISIDAHDNLCCKSKAKVIALFSAKIWTAAIEVKPEMIESVTPAKKGKRK